MAATDAVVHMRVQQLESTDSDTRRLYPVNLVLLHAKFDVLGLIAMHRVK